jgi:hypothetical protein
MVVVVVVVSFSATVEEESVSCVTCVEAVCVVWPPNSPNSEKPVVMDALTFTSFWNELEIEELVPSMVLLL